MQHIRNHERVATIHEGASIREAADRMAHQGIGCLVAVGDDGRVSGILTDRDLCLRAAAFDRDPDESKVERSMTHQPCTASVSASREERIGVMRRNGVRRIPLIDEEGRPVELVSLDDELAALASTLSHLADVAQPGKRHGPLRLRVQAPRDPITRANRLFEVDPEQRICESDDIDKTDLMRAIYQLRSRVRRSSS